MSSMRMATYWSLFLDGKKIGGAAITDSILFILLESMRTRAGRFHIENSAGNTVFTLTTKQPWDGEERMDNTVKHDWEPGYFAITDSDMIYAGYHRGSLFNGWRAPVFTRRLTTVILSEWATKDPYDRKNHTGYRFGWRGDVIHFWDGNTEEDYDIKPVVVVVESNAVLCWPIGEGFTWNLVSLLGTVLNARCPHCGEYYDNTYTGRLCPSCGKTWE